MLLIWPLLFTAYSLTLSDVFFIYSLIIMLILLIAMINIQPLKRIGGHYPLVDIIFTFLLCFYHIARLGTGVVAVLIETYNAFYDTLSIIKFLTSVIPLIYISFLIGSWFFSKISIACIPAQLSFLPLFTHAFKLS